MSKRFVLLVLSFIILLAAFLRFYNLGTNPPSLTWDEAAWGYNSYTLGLDGKDEFGRFLPITYIESFGDFKPPVYAYLGIIPVKIFGLNEFATRFPSAFFGTLTVLLTFFLVKRIFWLKKESEIVGLIAAFFLAISPWHIMLSRAAFEANVSTFFIVAGVLTFLVGVQDKKWFLILSAISFTLSMYTFNTARIVSPILVLVLAIAFRNRLFINKTQTIIAALVGVLMIAPAIPFLLSPQAGLRFKEVNIFSDPEIVKTANQSIQNDNNAIWSKLLHNRRVLYGFEYVKHYFDNLSPNFLFIKGDGNPKFSTQNVGQMYIFDILFLGIGLLLLIRKREGNWWLVPVWILVGIIPAATARETPHALRIETTLPMFQIIVAYGVYWVGKWALSIKFGRVVVAVACLLLLFNFVFFWHDLMGNYKYLYSAEWQYGYKDSIAYVNENKDKYDKVQVTQQLGRPYIYYLFYDKINPEDFRKTATINRDPFGFVDVAGFGKYTFPKDYKVDEKGTQKVLYIATPYHLPAGAQVLKTFKLLNGEPVLVAYTI